MDQNFYLSTVKDELVETMRDTIKNIKQENEIIETETTSQALLDWKSSFVVCKEEVGDGCSDMVLPSHCQADTYISEPVDCTQTFKSSVVKVLTIDNNQKYGPTQPEDASNRTTSLTLNRSNEVHRSKASNKSGKLELETVLINDMVSHEEISAITPFKIPDSRLLKRYSSRFENEIDKTTKRAKIIQCDVGGDYAGPVSVSDSDECRDVNKKLICDKCDYKASSKADIEYHSVIHSCKGVLENIHVCSECAFVTKCKSSFTVHVKHHTEKPFSCNVCSYKSRNKSDLVRHIRTHTGEKPFSCKLCSYKSGRNTHLVTHMRTHTGEKPFSCTLCSYKSGEKSELVKHMRTHTGEKPFSCKLCSYKSGRYSNLVTHMRTHTGEKPFSCTLCSYKSGRNSNLVTHMMTHTGEKPFSCCVCSYKCTNKRYLVNHMRTHTSANSFLAIFDQ